MSDKLREAAERIKRLVTFYQQFPDLTLDAMDSMTEVTMNDLQLLLTALADSADAPLEVTEEMVGLDLAAKECIETFYKDSDVLRPMRDAIYRLRRAREAFHTALAPAQKEGR